MLHPTLFSPRGRYMKLLCHMLFLFSLSPLFAKDLQRGEEISKQIENFNKGIMSESSTALLILIDPNGAKVERKLEYFFLEGAGSDESDKSLCVFELPKDVSGTKFLTWSHRDKDNEQWLYLPSLRKTKRIAGSSKTGSFMGSEFSYEDIGGSEREKYLHAYLGDETLSYEGQSRKVWKLERSSKSTLISGYSKQTMWIDQEYHRPLKIDYFDRKGELMKSATFNGHTIFPSGEKKIFLPSSIEMKNIQTRKQSIFSWSDRKIGVKLDKKMFDAKKW
jgi:outer membrane lipoprotein-sorting protein